MTGPRPLTRHPGLAPQHDFAPQHLEENRP